MVTLRIESNAAKIAGELRRLPAKLRARAYRKALRAAGNAARVSITDAIQRRTEVRTGTLRQARAIRLSVEVQRRIHEARLSWRSDAWYGLFIARGTRQGLTGGTAGTAVSVGTAGISPRVFTDDTSESGLPPAIEKQIVDAYIAAFIKDLEKAWQEAFDRN